MTRPATVDALAAVHGDVQVLPVSFGQQRLYVLDQLAADAAAYTIPIALRLRGRLDATALEGALNAVVARHEALRTVFALEGGEPVQVVLPAVGVPLVREDLASVAEADRHAALAARVTAEVNAPFDLSRGPLMRATLLRLGTEDHALLLTLHHIVADGTSIGVLYDELESAYSALATGREPSLPPLPLQYPDYAVWQRSTATGDAAARQLEYWADRLRDSTVLELVTDRSRPAMQSTAGDKRETTIPASVAEALRAVARRERGTPYMAFLAAFVALLHRYTGQTDIVVGAITAGRQRAELERLIGLFVNTLAIRVDAAGAPSFVELFARVRERALEAFANQDVPFEQVVEAVQPARDLSRNPIFQVAFQYFDGLSRDLRLAGLTASRIPGVKNTTKFDLTLMVHASDDGSLRVVAEFATALFDASTVDRMLAHYATLLSSIVREPSAPIDRLALLDATEDAMVTSRWNATDAPRPDWTTPARILVRAAEQPDAVAVRAGEDVLTYAELARRSARVARALGDAGVGADDRVGVCMERGASLVAAMLGVWRAGAAYVPVDPAYPSERIAHVLGDAGVRAVLTDAASRDRLPDVAATVLLADALPAGDVDQATALRAPAVGAESAAYVIYTSGSTGTPKGVVVPHRALSNFLASMAARPGLSAGDAIVAVTTVSFDIAGLELWLPLVVGAEVVLASRATVADGVALRALVEATTRRVSGRVLVQATPTTWLLLVEAEWAGAPNVVLLCGGEAWPAGLAAALLPRGAALWNVYGPTETTIWSARQRVERANDVTLGEPLANTQLYVLEPTGAPAPLGVAGELWIGGVGLALGYHERPALTAERFVEHPRFGRLYRTGDRVVRRADGALRYLGRLDDQIKLRGFRIELGEIESVLAAQPGVAQAAAALRGSGVDARLVAYVVLSTGESRDAARMSALTDGLRRALPEYMVPSAIVPLDALPLTPNGKVDRRALPDVEAESRARVYVAPRSPLEAEIAEVWREVLSVERVGVEDDFFALGGHSLRAMRVVAGLAEVVPVQLGIAALFEARTVSALAALAVSRMVERDATVGDAELEALLAELEGLSDEDAVRMLASREAES
jgi:amino acid adenylation domain-containing protein